MSSLYQEVLFASLDSLLVLLSTCLVTSIVLFGVARLTSREGRKLGAISFYSIIGVAILGGVSGYAGGLSRTGVVGDIIPAALSLLGGLVVYLFGVDQSKGPRIAILVISFTVALFVNYTAAAKLREPGEQLQKRLEICTRLFSDVQLYKDEAAMKRANQTLWPMCGPTFIQLYPPNKV